jgi:ribA/ribD-fused uncharacterized protein
MPNGDYQPECFYCEFYTSPKDVSYRGCCGKHGFAIPVYGGDFICRDWRLHPKHHGDSLHFYYVPDFLQRELFQSLVPGFLYYYSHPRLYVAFDSFKALQNLMVGINIHRDDEFGWSICLKDFRRKYFPDAGRQIVINLDETECLFEVVDAQRTRRSGGGRTPSGEWETHYYTANERIVYCPDSPEALCRWLDKYNDVEALITDKRVSPLTGETWGEITLQLGISAYLEIIQEGSVYKMRPERLPEHKEGFMRVGHTYFYAHDKPYRELSNSWPAPFALDGAEWPTVEHYFQAQKAAYSAECERIRKAPTPELAKQLRRSVCLRPNWLWEQELDRPLDEVFDGAWRWVKEDVMLRALHAKFSQNPDLAEILLSTGDCRLHEDSPHDQYWGVRGKDRLGRLLEYVREGIKCRRSSEANTVHLSPLEDEND